ncbi:MAG: PP2C family serine/threonine-protein phosphatase [Acidobacteriota bacterium]
MGFITSTIVGMTDRGLVREQNEDCFIIGYPRTGQVLASKCRVTLPLEANSLLLVISDGMGGALAGEVASHLTVDTIRRELTRLPSILSSFSRLEAAIEAANLAVWRQQKEDPRMRGMGATVTALLVERDLVYISEIGDSRAYILRDRRIKQITSDQTMYQALLDSGSISPAAAQRGIHRNVLLQAIGQEEYLQVACRSMELHSGDLFLLCSDGLYSKLKEDEIQTIIANGVSLEAAAQQLIELAKARGGEDNITVILAQFDGDCLKQYNAGETLTRSIKVITRFNPQQETIPRPLRQIRSASYQDWVATAVVDYFADTDEQRMALAGLGRYGDYILFRKGDRLVFQGERPPDTHYHYWLVSGRYRVEVTPPEGPAKTVALIVSPTDTRTNETIADGNETVPVKRQFFTASVAMLNNAQRNATIWCEDDENIAIRVPLAIYQQVAAILGERFLNAVRHS